MRGPTESGRIGIASLLGVSAGYIAIGFATIALVPRLGTSLRLVAWIASAMLLLLHVAYERRSLSSVPRTAAVRAALAVAIAAFVLALSAMAHAIARGRPGILWGIAIVVWPAATGLCAFIVAFLLASVIGRGESAP